MDQMREANERLIVAAIDAQNRSDEADVEAAQARTELDNLMRQLRDANDRLTKAATQAHTMAEDARRATRGVSASVGPAPSACRMMNGRRLAVDLHDSTAQRLAALTMNLDVVEGARKRSTPDRAGRSRESRSLAEECSREVRTLARICCTHPCSMRRGCCWRCAGSQRLLETQRAFMWSSDLGRRRKIAGADRGRRSSASCRKASRTSIGMHPPRPPRFVSRTQPIGSRSTSKIKDEGSLIQARQNGALRPGRWVWAFKGCGSASVS